MSKEQITASYIYNFAKNIEWPDESKMTDFTIALYRVDSAAMEEALFYLDQKFRVRGKPVRVVRANTLKSLSNYHIVFTEQVGISTINSIYSVIKDAPVLLVTEEMSRQQMAMINLLSIEGRRLGFEVNTSNILNQGLTPLPELILNGGTEIDVAKLYREGQASLVEMQKQLASREAVLEGLAKKIRIQEDVNFKMEQQLTELGKSIESSRVVIEQQTEKIREQVGQLTTSRKEAADGRIALQAQKKEMALSQKNLKRIQSDIRAREQKLDGLNNKIAAQETQITAQRGEISELDETVSSQQTALKYFKVIILLAVMLIFTAFAAFWVKKRDNKRLADHGRDLQLAQDRLTIAKRKAEEASQAKSDFLSLMTHELRTPLQAIIGYTDVVLEELRMTGEDDFIDDLDRVIANSERLLRLINSVLDMAKVESGQMELKLSSIRLKVLVDEAVNSVKPLLDKNGNKLRVAVNEGKSEVFADAEKLLHIMINLLSNATKFTENGEIDIRASIERERIIIIVKDSGVGMNTEQQANIFDQFKQADSSTTRKYQGTGLGLAIVKQFTELMGGKVSVESKERKGAAFTVIIPLPIAGSH
ncbi:MAG: YfiR/HmsC family protein [Agarilytica sp.]